MTTRRDFVIGVAGLSPLFAAAAAAQAGWDQGKLVHLLPTVSHDRILIKASFQAPLDGAPQLHAGAALIYAARKIPRTADFWQFDLSGLKPQTPYRLSLTGSDGRALCEPWTLSTFPAPDTMPSRLRLLIYTCAGGHDALNPPGGPTSFLPALVRRRLLMRGLSFKPDAIIANGDHVYWDLRAPRLSKTLGASPQAAAYAGTFDRSQTVLDGPNEQVLRRSAGPQIVPLYGTLCRSTPSSS
jgi:hypothetical protein